MNTCDTCKWWTNARDPRSKFNKVCKNQAVIDSSDYRMKDDEAGIEQDETEDDTPAVNFFTGPSFGCVKWEAK